MTDLLPASEPGPPADPGMLAERKLRLAEASLEVAHERAADAEATSRQLRGWIAELERSLAEARHETEQLSALLAWRERAHRGAEQRAFAERARRLELEDELGLALREAAGRSQELDAALARVRELEHEVDRLRRVAYEAEHAGRAALAAPLAVDGAAMSPASFDRAFARLRAELDEVAVAVERERRARGEVVGRVEKLEREVNAVSPARASAVDPERFSAALMRLREASPPEESTVEDTSREEPSLADTPPSASVADRVRAPSRLDQRSGPWLRRAFRLVAGANPDSAGRLFLALLPAQGRVHPDALAYDVVLGERSCVHVTVQDGHTDVQRDVQPRDPSAVKLQIAGDSASVARLLVAGRWRRMLGRDLAKVRGDRAALPALLDLIRTPLHLGQLLDCGLRLEPTLAFTLAAAMIEPAWTAGERWTLAHQTPLAPAAGASLQVRARNRVTAAASAPANAVATTVVCPPDELLPVIAGESVSGLEVRGESRPLELLQGWVARAQRGKR